MIPTAKMIAQTRKTPTIFAWQYSVRPSPRDSNNLNVPQANSPPHADAVSTISKGKPQLRLDGTEARRAPGKARRSSARFCMSLLSPPFEESLDDTIKYMMMGIMVQIAA